MDLNIHRYGSELAPARKQLLERNERVERFGDIHTQKSYIPAIDRNKTSFLYYFLYSQFSVHKLLHMSCKVLRLQRKISDEITTSVCT